MEFVVFDPARHCGALRRSTDLKGPGVKGDPCRHPKGWGTDHHGIGTCRLHGGKAPGGERAAAKAKAAIALATLGLPVQKEPQQALLDAVYEAAGNVAFLRQEVQSMGAQLVGGVFSAGKDVGIFQASEEVRAMVQLYGQWNDRLVKYAKAAIDAGIAERAVRIAEQQADAIVRVVNAALAAVELTPEQRKLAVTAAVSELRNYEVVVPAGAERN